MKKHIYTILSILVVLLVISSCDDQLSLSPSNEFTEENYWTSVEKAQMVLNTAYSQMINSTRFFYNAAMSDNAYLGRGTTADVGTIAQGIQTPSTQRMENEWSDRYSGIKTCNVFLENVDQVPDMDESLKTRMEAEIRFIRAYQYFRLTNWFGPIPLFKKDLSVDESQTISQASHDSVISFVHSELADIQDDLPVKGEYSEDNQGRITKGAAIALNARVYLYNNDWQDVVNSTEKLIGTTENGDYSLFPSYRGIFMPENQYNQEVIFDFGYAESKVTHNQMFDLVPLTAGARLNAMGPTQELVDAYPMMNGEPIDAQGSGYDPDHPFQNRDPRLDATLIHHQSVWQDADGGEHTIYIEPGSAPNENAARDEYQGSGSNSTQTGYYWRKYYNPNVGPDFSSASGLNLIAIRYADVLLMYAEAKNELGEMNEQVWNETIRALRARAGLDNSALAYGGSLTQDELREIIRRERRVETAFENLRIFDLRRWDAEDKLSGKIHGALFPNVSPTDSKGHILSTRDLSPNENYLWPIPQPERDLNDNLDQNSGY